MTRSLKNTSIRVKVLTVPLILVLALLIVSFLAIYGLNEQHTTLRAVNDIALERITLIHQFTTLSEQVQSDVFRISVLRSMNLPKEEIQPIQTRLEQGLSDTNVIYGQMFTRWPLDSTERTIMERMKGPLDAFQLQARQAAIVVMDNPSFGVLLVRSSTVPFDKFRATLAELLDNYKTKINQITDESNQKARKLTVAIVAMALLVALAATLTTILFSTRLISEPIQFITGLMHRLAGGDLAVELADLKGRDEIGEMARAVEVFRNSAMEKAKLDKELRESEDRFRNLYNNALVGLFRTRISDGKPIQINQHYAELAGYETVEECLQDFVASEHYADLKLRDLMLEQIMQSGEVKSFEAEIIRKDNRSVWISFSARAYPEAGYIEGALVDITGRKHTEEVRDKLVLELREALGRVKTLSGMLPICSHCKKIRDDKGYWNQIESYIHAHSDTEFSHGICPECAKKYHPDMDIYDDNGEVTED